MEQKKLTEIDYQVFVVSYENQFAWIITQTVTGLCQKIVRDEFLHVWCTRWNAKQTSGNTRQQRVFVFVFLPELEQIDVHIDLFRLIRLTATTIANQIRVDLQTFTLEKERV
jgi:hypothetical protein